MAKLSYKERPLLPIIPRDDGLEGNRCGHNPEYPVIFLMREKMKELADKIPEVLVQTVEALQAYYGHPEKVFPSLSHIRGPRQQRSERRESCGLVLTCLIEKMDILTMEVLEGDPSNGVLGLGYKRIMAITGLSYTRVFRAMEDLKKAGLVSLKQIIEKLRDNVYMGFNAIIKISHVVFDRVRTLKWLRREQWKRRDAIHKKDKRAEKQRRKAMFRKAMEGGPRPVGQFLGASGVTSSSDPRGKDDGVDRRSQAAISHITAIRDILKDEKKPQGPPS